MAVLQLLDVRGALRRIALVDHAPQARIELATWVELVEELIVDLLEQQCSPENASNFDSEA